ncbi:hypothetical protein BU15DRAFT_30378, partial [Melanogaster broomeanus]
GSILVYASDQLLSSGDSPLHPTHTFSGSLSTLLLAIQPNPGDIPDLVAVLRDCSNSPGSLSVELLDVQKLMSSGGWMAGKSPSTTPTSISWSPKGKQLAFGLQSGDIVTYSPTATATPKSSIPRPSSASNMSVISIQWLSTSSFHAVYAPPGQLTPDVDQVHFHVSLDSKSNTAQDIKFNCPCFPSPGLRPPGGFVVGLRGWDPSKVLLFIGDSTSSDIGVIGSMTDGTSESWHNLSLEETSSPSLPLDKDENDTIMVGLDVDLTNDSSFRHSTASGEALDLPAPPIMYAYASDGTILGWHILNVSGTSYPGMVIGSDAFRASSMTLVPSTTASSPFGQTAASAFVSTTSSSAAFGAFSSTGPAKFGQSAFSGFGAPVQTTTPTPQPLVEPIGADGGPSFRDLGLGAANSQDADSKPSIFGNASVQLPSGTQSTGGNLIRPGTGFGAFTSFDQKSPFASAPAFASTTQLSPAFSNSPFQTKPESALPNTVSSAVGQSGFSQTTPTFGQSSFGMPAFGRSSFGQPQAGPSMIGESFFGTTTVPSATTSTSTGGAFTAFASGTQSAFGAVATKKDLSAKPVWATNDSSKSNTPEYAFEGAPTHVLGKPTDTPTPKTSLAFASREDAASSAFVTPLPFSAASHFTARESAVRDDNSRSPSPAQSQRDGPTPSLSFTNSAAGPTAGAFSTLKTTPSAFVKPPSGFFGEMPKDSPFFAPKPPESKPVSAFSLVAAPTTPTPPKPSSAAPTFGTPSMPGGALKGSFTPAIAAPVQSAIAPGVAFSAFSNNGGGFAAISSGGNKPFSDLLRAVGEESNQSLGRGPSAAGMKGKAAEPIPVQEPSLDSISSSTSSSFVNVSAEEGEAIEESTTVDGGLQDDTESFLSEVPSESEVSEEESEYAVDVQVEEQPQPTEFLLPTTPTPTRSASTTPKAEPPKITVSTPPPPQAPSPPGSGARVSTASELSTTPPGSPVKDAAQIPSPVPVSVPKPSPPASSPFALAPRPNNRPMRSSPLASTPLFLDGEPENFPPFTPGSGTSSLWSTPSKSGETTPFTTKSALPSYSTQPSPPCPKKPVEATSPSVSTSPMATPVPASSSSPSTTPTPEQGMQAECLFLLQTLDKELENLKLLANAVSTKTVDLKKPSGVTPRKADLGDTRKWVFGDIKEYGRILADVRTDVEQIKLQRVSLRKALRELDSNMLKAGTRKEEIIRFNRAKTDAEFAKMLKVRTLGPEYVETQSQLRRGIRAIRDRVQKLEDHLQASKKRINELKTGRPVNRTFRNIAIAIDQQKKGVSNVRIRMTKLDISEGTGNRDKLTGSSSTRPMSVTPNVAVTTAAALNAERSAQRLKRALLGSRTQPLLNTMAIAAPALTSFQTPHKATVVEIGAKTSKELSPSTPMSFPSSLPVWTPP